MTFIKMLLIALIAYMANQFAYAKSAKIFCQTPSMNKQFELNENKVTFIQENQLENARHLASINAARTRVAAL